MNLSFLLHEDFDKEYVWRSGIGHPNAQFCRDLGRVGNIVSEPGLSDYYALLPALARAQYRHTAF